MPQNPQRITPNPPTTNRRRHPTTAPGPGLEKQQPEPRAPQADAPTATTQIPNRYRPTAETEPNRQPGPPRVGARLASPAAHPGNPERTSRRATGASADLQTLLGGIEGLAAFGHGGEQIADVFYPRSDVAQMDVAVAHR